MDKKTSLPLPTFLLDKSPNIQKSAISSSKPLNKCIVMPGGLVSSGIQNNNVQNKYKQNDEFKAPLQKHQFTKPRFLASKPHFSSPKGMLMPSYTQPPPMYGPRGPTIPAKFLEKPTTNFQSPELWCENCDKEFNLLSDLQIHKSKHKKCGIDGCSFEAHDSIVRNHIKLTHSSGLYDKVRKLSTPEEIAKWREERKKRYPTRLNVELRQKAQEERMQRGERIGKRKNRFGNKQDRRPIRNKNVLKDQRIVLKRPANHKRTSNVKKRKEVKRRVESKIKEQRKKIEETKNETTEELEGEYLGKLPRFKGTLSLPDYIRPKSKSTELKVNPLINLLGMYGSDEDSSDEECDNYKNNGTETSINENGDENKPEEDSFTKEKNSCTENKIKTNLVSGVELPDVAFNEKPIDLSTNNCLNKSDSDDEMPEEVPIIRETNSSESMDKEIVQQQSEENCNSNSTEQCETPFSKESRKIRKRKRGRERKLSDTSSVQTNKISGLLDYSKLRTRRQNTMLAKLLESDIIHERNVLLQCVRFVVENNYFGIGNK